MRWTPVVEHDRPRVTLALDIVPQNGYPFEVRVEVTYALHPELRAVGDDVGAQPRHRAARRSAPASTRTCPRTARRWTRRTVQLPARQRLVLDDASVPVGVQSVAGTRVRLLRRGKRLKSLRMDDGFTGLHIEDGRGAVEVRSKAGGARLWFDETFRYLQVFTLDELGGRRSAGRRDRADDVRRRRVQLHARADRARPGRHLGRFVGHRPTLSAASRGPGRVVALQRDLALGRVIDDPRPGSPTARGSSSHGSCTALPSTSRSSGTQRRT